MGTHAEVLDGLAGVPLAAEQDGVRTGGRTQGELVEGEDLAAGLEDALPGRGGEAEGGDRELRDDAQTDIVGDGADDDDDLGLAVRGASGLCGDAGQGDGRAVDLGEEETMEDGLYSEG